MKKTLLICFAVLAATFGFAQSAVDFTANDCSSNSHNLFTELNSGKVIVITWVMPCGACISVASTAASTVSGMSNPNVKFYLVDDYANTSCSSLSSWATTNSITTNAIFSNSVINMTDYGSTGMQKTIVLGGGTCHSVFFNQTGAITSSALQTAINNALTPCTGIVEPNKIDLGLNIFPNPSSISAKINYTLPASANVSIEVVDQLGQKVNFVLIGTQPAGKMEYLFNIESLNAGVYFVKLNAGEAYQTSKLIITR